MKYLRPALCALLCAAIITGCTTLKNLRCRAVLAPYSEPPPKGESPRFWLKYQWRY